MNEQTWVIGIEELQIGTILSFDLLDANGNVLHKAGTPVSERLKERLRSNGIESVSIRGRSEFSSDQIEKLLDDSFDPALRKRATAAIESTRNLVKDSLALLVKGQPIDGAALRAESEKFVECASKDVAATLSTIVGNQSSIDSSSLESISLHAAKMALLSVAACLTQGQSESFAMSAGFAALLHDVGLIISPGLYEKALHGSLSILEIEEYRNHPFTSMDLLRKSPEIPERTLQIVSQVHEQADGSGYPLGLKLGETRYEASILNAVDTFLTLTDAKYRKRIVPSDAILYLIANASKGRYCPKAVQSMIKCMSVFPIGSVVVLDDESKAVVIRANPEAPAKPTVRLLKNGAARIDLQESRLSIAAPYVDLLNGFHRLAKSEMGNLLWGLPAAS
jgi:HD-GYP domain-containing protein (c-di-GMP phosphodiesterase class II)